MGAAQRSTFSALGLTIVFVLVAALTVFAFLAHAWMPEVASSHGKGIDRVIYYLLFCTGVIFFFGHIVLALFIWKYSRGHSTPSPEVSRGVEWKWAIGIMLFMCVVAEGGVFIVGMPVFKEIYVDTPKDAMEVEVVGKQFEWIFRYPGPDGKFGRVLAEKVHDTRNPVGLDKSDPDAKDDIVRRGSFNLPVDKTTILRLRTQDVLHSFTIIAFRSKQDLISGYPTQTKIKPTQTGKFEIACAELCGLGHYRMQATVNVQTEDEFKKWLSEQEPWF